MSTDLAPILLHFIQLFHDELPAIAASKLPSNQPTALTQLTDGVLLYHLLHTVSPHHFPLSEIVSPATSDTHRLDNVTHLLLAIETWMNDISALANHIDIADIIKTDQFVAGNDTAIITMIQLMILCMVNSEQKEDVIGKIMEMNDSEQATLMVVLNEQLKLYCSEEFRRLSDADSLLLSPRTPSTSTANNNRLSLTSNASDVSASSPSTSSATVRATVDTSTSGDTASVQATITLLERQLRESQKLTASLQHQLTTAATEHQLAIQNAINDTIIEIETKHSEKNKSDIAKLTQTVDDLEHRLAESNAQLKRAAENQVISGRERIQLNERLTELMNELKRRDDELQILRVKSDQVNILENKIKHMSIRLDAAGDIKLQAEYAEEQANKSMERILQLERQVRDIDALKAQVQRYKDKVIETSTQLMEINVKEESRQIELNDINEINQTLKKHNLILTEELRNVKTELITFQTQLKAINDSDRYSSTGSNNGNALTQSPSTLHTLRERIRRLELENEELKKESDSGTRRVDGDNDSAHELDIARSMAKASQQKYVEAQRRIALLESQMRKLSTNPDGTVNAAATAALADVNEMTRLQTELQTAKDTIARLRTNGDGNAANGATADTVPASEMAALEARMETLRVRNGKLETYGRTMKKKFAELQAIQRETADQLNALNDEQTRLRAELQQRVVEADESVKRHSAAITASERERNLVCGAFYAMGVEYSTAIISGRAVKLEQSLSSTTSNNDATTNAPHTWLSQQRAKLKQ